MKIETKTELVKIPPPVKQEFKEQVLGCLLAGDAYGIKELFSEFCSDEIVVLFAMFNSEQRRVINQYLRE